LSEIVRRFKTFTANRARQANLHGQGAHQSAEYEANTRQKMEEELDQQRVDRAKPPTG